ncbi:MAG: hypothetical protein J6Q48_09715 [Bacteroidaceae bacterium]|nr:hypothetical protein [Bacteroidaceae bacterium]
MPIVVTKEIAAFLAGRMEVELDWGDVYTFEQRLSMFTVFIQACQIGEVNPEYGIKQFLNRSKDLVESQ